MTTTPATTPTSTPTTSQTAAGTPVGSRYGVAAAASILGAVALNAFGIWGDGSPGGAENAWLSFLIVCGFIATGAAIVFGWLVPRGLKRIDSAGQLGISCLVLSIVALVLVLVFWTGLPPVLAAGGIVLGLAGRGTLRSALATSATAIGALAIVADVAIYVMDFLSTNGML